MPLSPRLQNLILLIFSVTFSLVSAEVVLRWLEPGRPWHRRLQQEDRLWQTPCWAFDPHVGARFSPSWNGSFVYRKGREAISVRSNRWGFRFPDHDPAKPPGTTRIALLGDSLTAALQVEDADHFRHRLEQKLRQNHPTQVLNFGIPGTGPVAHLNMYRHFARHFDPDWVVLGIYTANDFTDDRGTRWRKDDGGLVDRPFEAAPGNFRKIVKANSALAMAIWTLGQRAAAPEALTTGNEPSPISLEPFELAGVTEAEYENKIAVWSELIRIVQEDSRSFQVVLFPVKPTVDGSGRPTQPESILALHKVLRKRLEAAGARVVDSTDLLGDHGRFGSGPWTKVGDYLSEDGHASLADVLARELSRGPR